MLKGEWSTANFANFANWGGEGEFVLGSCFLVVWVAGLGGVGEFEHLQPF